MTDYRKTIGWGVMSMSGEKSWLWGEFYRPKRQANNAILDIFMNGREYPGGVDSLTQAQRDSELKRIWRQEDLKAIRVELVEVLILSKLRIL